MKKKDPKKEYLWVEKYRPQTIEDCILPEHLMNEIKSLKDNKEIHNLLFVGGPGVGKTTVAKALCNDINADVLVINASKDGNIDTLRNTIQNFAMCKSMEGRKKVCILDEADYLNPNSTQPALRNFIEEFSGNCRFILTCNYPKRIIEPLHSRLRTINFSFTKKEQAELAKSFLKTFCKILEDEKIEYNKKDVVQFILRYTPDYRKILNELQGMAATGKLLSNLSSSDDLDKLAKLISDKNFTECRKWVAENYDIGFNHFLKIKTNLEPLLDKKSIPDMFLILNEFDRTYPNCTDLEIHITSCIVNLMFELEYN